MKKNLYSLLSLLVVASLFVAACGSAATPTPAPTEPPPTAKPTEPPPPTEVPPTEAPTEVPWTAPEGALVSVKADTAPALDGVAGEAIWKDAPATEIEVSGGMNFDGSGGTTATLKSVYSGDMVYFLVTYSDPTESFFRSPWQKQADGTWKKIKDPNDKGGDNNTVYEDKFAFIWPIDNSIKNFDKQGCFAVCHAGENPDIKPYGNKYTAGEGQMGDIWHWKSIRNLNQVDDQYLDWTKVDTSSPEAQTKTIEAGRHSDPKDSGGYADNVNEAKDGPGFTSPAVDLTTGAPGFIIDGEKVVIDPAAIKADEYIPGILKSEIVGDRGDLSAGWKYADGKWTIEFSRKLVTASEKYDVQFNDLTATYYFGFAIFENAQVRHAYENGSTPFVFKP